MMQPTDGFDWLQAPAGRALICRALAPLARHLFTTRRWTLGLPQDGGSPKAWREVSEALGIDPERLVRGRQVHGAAVIVRHAAEGSIAPEAPMSGLLTEADIILSDDSRMAVAIETADCVPILIADRRSGAVAAAHAGWRGLAAGVPRTAVGAMVREFGSAPADLVAALGPSISASRYEVGRDVRECFDRAGFAPDQLLGWFADTQRADRWRFDGWLCARDQLEAAGVPRSQIHVAELCTAAQADLWCSYRRDGKGCGRMAAAIRPHGRSAGREPRR